MASKLEVGDRVRCLRGLAIGHIGFVTIRRTPAGPASVHPLGDESRVWVVFDDLGAAIETDVETLELASR